MSGTSRPRLRDRLEAGPATLGAWSVLADPSVAELLGRAGFDWVCVDLQHGLAGSDGLVGILQALELGATPSLVRVPWNEPAAIMRALDTGAHGVIVPMVDDATAARSAVGACRYPPSGYRSWGPVRAALGVPAYSPEGGDRDAVCLVMIETARGLAELDEILAVPGLDGVFVGPADLALAHGLAPTVDVHEAAHVALVDEVLDRARAAGVLTGIYAGSPEMAAHWRARGFDLVAVTSDAALLTTGAAAVLAALQAT